MALKDFKDCNFDMKRPADGVGSDEITNTSSVSGESVEDALDILLAATGTLPFVAKGDVLTYTGKAIAVQTIGTDGMVPVADASKANGWEWKTNPSSIPRTFAYTVGASGGDYTKISTLLAAHAAPKSIFVMDGIYNESAADLAIPANTTIMFESASAIINMGAKSLLLSGAGATLIGGTIEGTVATADLVKISASYIKLLGTKILSTAVGNPVSAQYLINAASTHENIIMDNVRLHFAGDWANERGIYFRSNSGRIQNPYFVAPAGSANNTVLINAASKSLVIDGVKTNTAMVNTTAMALDGTGGKIVLSNSGSRDVAMNLSANVVFCEIDNCVLYSLAQSASKVSNCTITALANAGSAEMCWFNNCKITGVVSGASVQPKYANCYIGTYTDSATGGKTDMVNCEINGTLSILSDYFNFSGRVNDTVSVDADRCSITGYVKEIGVLGSYNRLVNVETADTFTITISGGTAVKNMIIGCSTAAAVADTGTGTVYTAEDNIIRP